MRGSGLPTKRLQETTSFSLNPDEWRATSGGAQKSLRISGWFGYNAGRTLGPVTDRGTDRYMQNIQKNPMVTVAEAAAVLGIDARTVREKLSSGDWKGEKRMIGMKEKWFMYRGELDRQLERLQLARPKERVSTQGLENIFEPADVSQEDTVEAESVEVNAQNDSHEIVTKVIEEVLSKVTEQFSKQLNAEKEVSFTLRKELEEKERSLRLLPDLQKQAEQERKTAEIRMLEVEALRKQVAAIEEEKAALKATVEELSTPWWKKWFTSDQPNTSNDR